MHILSSMTIRAKKTEVLATLRENRGKHTAIVEEARAGYMDKAQVALNAKLDQLRSGKLAALSFSLRVPLDYTKVYDTAIRMLELHQDETIELDAGQVRNLMQDEWDWTDQFYGTNIAYSKMANDMRPEDD
jgi:K+-sensing histidine kinase KdpD